MTFDDLPLYDAVYAVRKAMEAAGENPGSDDWTADEQKRRELTGRIVAALTTDTEQRMIDAFIGFRKSPNVDGKKKIELIMDVRRAHGDQCFYRGRGRGECSEEVDLDRIVPGSRGGRYTVENCMLVCSRHNRMRGDQAIEEFCRTEPRPLLAEDRN